MRVSLNRAERGQTGRFLLEEPGAPSGTLCIVACLARMIAVDTPHDLMHAPPR